MLNKSKISIITVLFLNAALITYCVSFFGLPRSSGNAKDLYPRQSETLTALQKTEKLFGGNLYDTITVTKGDNDDFLLSDIEDALAQVAGIDKIISPTESDRTGRTLGFLTRNDSGYRFLLKMALNLTDAQRKKLHKDLNDLLKNNEKRLSRNGSFYISESLTEAIETETLKLVPICVFFLLVVTVILFKSISICLLVLGAPLLALISVTFTSTILGIPLGAVSQLAPPFIISIGTAYGIHLVLSILTEKKIARETAQAVILASLTTSIGIFSLILLDVQGVTEFAYLAGIGNILAMLYSLIILKSFEKRIKPRPTSTFSIKTPSISLRKNLSLLVFTISLFSCYGLTLLYVDTNPESFLIANGPTEREVQESKEVFKGSRFLNLLVRKINGNGFSDDQILSLESLKNNLEKHPNIFSVVSPHIAIIKKNRVKSLELEQFSIIPSNTAKRITHFLISKDKKYIRFVIETNLDGRKLLSTTHKIIDEISNDKSLKQFYFEWSGFELVMATQAQAITFGILQSLLSTLLVVFILLLSITRSLTLSTIGLIPNIIPLVSVFGLIGLFFQEISLGAALVATAALGIAVDNTFHFIIHWLKESKNKTTEEASTQTLKVLIKPFSYTTTILSLGFSALIAARVAPTFQFGTLLIVTLLIGLLADISVLPTLLNRKTKR